MNTVLFNHPHKDTHDGTIVTPIKIEESHSGTNVIYLLVGDESERIMSLKTWRKCCVAINFKNREGA